MPKKKRVSRRAQLAATYAECQFARDKREHCYGSAKIPLQCLVFSHSSARETDETNVQRLLSTFQLVGCLRLDVRYHVPAVIDHHLLTHALTQAGASMDDLRSEDPTRWPRLTLPDGAEIECLHGQHRAAAARRFLPKADQWWMIDLYSSAIGPDFRCSLAEQTSNEMPLSAGQIYFHILRCDPDESGTIDAWLAQIQTDNSCQEVGLLYERKNLNSAFGRLARIPAFGPSMQAGNIRALMGVKYDEEILHYLSYVYDVWSFLLGGDEVAMARVDRYTIDQLQSRSPANCSRDRNLLAPKVESGSIFYAFNLEARRTVWTRLLIYRRLILSL